MAIATVTSSNLKQWTLQSQVLAEHSLGNILLLDHGLDSSSSVSQVFGINTLERGIALSLGLSDSISVSFSVLVVVGMVLALCHFS